MTLRLLIAAAVSALAVGTASAQAPVYGFNFTNPYTGYTTRTTYGYNPYTGVLGGYTANFNPWTGSVYRPWAGTVTKPSGNYYYVPGTGTYTPWGKVPGSGIYQNPWSGNQYNPASGLYLRRYGW